MRQPFLEKFNVHKLEESHLVYEKWLNNLNFLKNDALLVFLHIPCEGSGPNFKNKAFKVVLLPKAPPHITLHL